MKHDFTVQIEDIMNHFNWERVHCVMVFLDWEWAFAKDGVPTLEEIKICGKQLLNSVAEDFQNVESEFFFRGTGGLMARIHVFEDCDPEITLSFELVSASS